MTLCEHHDQEESRPPLGARNTDLPAVQGTKSRDKAIPLLGRFRRSNRGGNAATLGPSDTAAFSSRGQSVGGIVLSASLGNGEMLPCQASSECNLAARDQGSTACWRLETRDPDGRFRSS